MKNNTELLFEFFKIHEKVKKEQLINGEIFEELETWAKKNEVDVAPCSNETHSSSIYLVIHEKNKLGIGRKTLIYLDQHSSEYVISYFTEGKIDNLKDILGKK